MRIRKNVVKGTRVDLQGKILHLIEDCLQDPLGSSGYEIARDKVRVKKLSSILFRIAFCDELGNEKLVIESDVHGNILKQNQFHEVSDFRPPSEERMKLLLCVSKTQFKTTDEQNAAIRDIYPGTNTKQRERIKSRLIERNLIERGPLGTYVVTPAGSRAIGIWRKNQTELKQSDANQTP